MTTSETNLDPRVRRTRQLLHQALMSLLAEKNFEEISVQDIAERATLNRATFYDHYQDKFALFEGIVAETFQAALRARFAQDSPFCPEKLRLLILTVCDYLAQLPGDCEDTASHKLLDLLAEAKVKAMMYELLVAGFQLAERPPELPSASLSATLVSWSIYGACKKWSKGRPRQEAQEFAAKILPVIAAGLPREI